MDFQILTDSPLKSVFLTVTSPCVTHRKLSQKMSQKDEKLVAKFPKNNRLIISFFTLSIFPDARKVMSQDKYQ